MQHGFYIAEFEKILFKHSYAISNASLSILAGQVNFSKLKDVTELDRTGFYEALVASIQNGSIQKQRRGVEDGIQILGEQDASEIIDVMGAKAKQRSFAPERRRYRLCEGDGHDEGAAFHDRVEDTVDSAIHPDRCDWLRWLPEPSQGSGLALSRR